MAEDSSIEWKSWQVYRFGKRNVFRLHLKWVQRGFLLERKGKVIPCRWTKDRKGVGTNAKGWRVWREEFGGWEYQTQSGSYRRVCKVEDSHIEQMEGAVPTIHLQQCFFLVLNSLLDWESVEKLNEDVPPYQAWSWKVKWFRRHCPDKHGDSNIPPSPPPETFRESVIHKNFELTGTS